MRGWFLLEGAGSVSRGAIRPRLVWLLSLLCPVVLLLWPPWALSWLAPLSTLVASQLAHHCSFSVLRAWTFPPCQASPIPAGPPGNRHCSFLATLVLLWLLSLERGSTDGSTAVCSARPLPSSSTLTPSP